MALTPRLELRQSQSLVMTPQLQQAIKLLQLSNIELTAYVEEQIEKNPLLEVDDQSETDSGEREQSTAKSTDNQTTSGDSSRDENQEADTSTLAATDQVISENGATTETESAIDSDYDNLYTEDSRADRQNEQALSQDTSMADWSNVRGASSNFESGGANLEATLSSQITLRDHLIEQLHMSIKDPTERAIGYHLIDTIDDAGYVREDLETISERLGTNPQVIEKTLRKLQTFEPVGIFCRDLAECLALQLAERTGWTPP